jgi:hypothetical protein
VWFVAAPASTVAESAGLGYGFEVSEAMVRIPPAASASSRNGFCPCAALEAVLPIGGPSASGVPAAPVSVKETTAAPLSLNAGVVPAVVWMSSQPPVVPAGCR